MTAPAPNPQTLEILDRLISFPTVSADSNLELIHYAEGLLEKAGFATQRLPDDTGKKAGLVARLGPKGPGGVLLSAHSDVVPVAGQDWTRPPFALTREGGRLYGRGTTDMKGYLAAMLSLAQRVDATSLAKPLMLSISYDEETGCQGIREMLPGLQQLDWAPDLCIVGEPTSMHPATGHKAKAALLASCHGMAGHSALAPRYVNALHLAAELIQALRLIQADYAASSTQDHAYDVPYSTVHAGRLHGGTALNIVPGSASIEFELRHLPADPLDRFLERLANKVRDIEAAFASHSADAAIEIEVTNAYPGLEIALDDPAVSRVARLCGSERTTKVAFGTEAGYFTQIGIPTVVCGPGDMEGQGHKPDEYLEAEQLGRCDQMMGRLLLELGSSSINR